MKKREIKKLLENAQEKDYIDIIYKMCKKDNTGEEFIIDWCVKNNPEYKTQAMSIKLMNLWKEAYKIIKSFNRYGGGPHKDVLYAYKCLNQMKIIINEYNIDWDTRKSIIDEIAEQLSYGYSVFSEILPELCKDFCKSKEETNYLKSL